MYQFRSMHKGQAFSLILVKLLMATPNCRLTPGPWPKQMSTLSQRHQRSTNHKLQPSYTHCHDLWLLFKDHRARGKVLPVLL
ncbi:hypothetical protein BDV97DRAFT_352085 [Delphinella strobiligena]|nr:hypothetical protein BDV97DRAFT_352085 [Delphinella strobiligena]